MKLVYTHENRFLVFNMQNILEAYRIETFLKNEFIAGAAGDIAPHETWLELWVRNDEDYERASLLINSTLEEKPEQTWVCPHCHETNSDSFDFCWNCQSEP
jgi:hypothetical protein